MLGWRFLGMLGWRFVRKQTINDLANRVHISSGANDALYASDGMKQSVPKTMLSSKLDMPIHEQTHEVYLVVESTCTSLFRALHIWIRCRIDFKANTRRLKPGSQPEHCSHVARSYAMSPSLRTRHPFAAFAEDDRLDSIG